MKCDYLCQNKHQSQEAKITQKVGFQYGGAYAATCFCLRHVIPLRQSAIRSRTKNPTKCGIFKVEFFGTFISKFQCIKNQNYNHMQIRQQLNSYTCRVHVRLAFKLEIKQKSGLISVKCALKTSNLSATFIVKQTSDHVDVKQFKKDACEPMSGPIFFIFGPPPWPG